MWKIKALNISHYNLSKVYAFRNLLMGKNSNMGSRQKKGWEGEMEEELLWVHGTNGHAGGLSSDLITSQHASVSSKSNNLQTFTVLLTV